MSGGSSVQHDSAASTTLSPASSTPGTPPPGLLVAENPSLFDRLRRHRTPINTVLSIIFALVLWQLISGHVSKLVMVPLQDIWDAFTAGVSGGDLGTDVWATTEAFLLAFVLSSVVGVVIGLLMAASDVAHDYLDPWVSALYSTPLIAIAPLFIVIFGLGLSAKIAVGFLLAVLPVIINTSAGIRTVDHSFIEGAYSFGAKKLQIFRKVLIPGAIPFIVTGLRLAIGRALIGVVVAEFFGSRVGLGHRVFVSAQLFDTANVFVGMFILMGIGMALFKLMYRLEKWIAPWREFRMP
jgi:NitT/TauT family transport system permease protein